MVSFVLKWTVWGSSQLYLNLTQRTNRFPLYSCSSRPFPSLTHHDFLPTSPPTSQGQLAEPLKITNITLYYNQHPSYTTRETFIAMGILPVALKPALTPNFLTENGSPTLADPQNGWSQIALQLESLLDFPTPLSQQDWWPLNICLTYDRIGCNWLALYLSWV